MIGNIFSDALFKLAVKEGCLELIIEQFENFMNIAEHNPDWITLLDTPTVRNKVKRKMISDTELFDIRFINFLMLLIKHHQIRYYKDVYEQWTIQTRLEQKIAFVQLYTAKALTKKQLEKLRSEVQDYLPNLEIEFRVKIDPSLIRGTKIIYQGRSIERSLKKTIDDMKSNI